MARTCDITLDQMQGAARGAGRVAGIGTLSRFFGLQDYSWETAHAAKQDRPACWLRVTLSVDAQLDLDPERLVPTSCEC